MSPQPAFPGYQNIGGNEISDLAQLADWLVSNAGLSGPAAAGVASVVAGESGGDPEAQGSGGRGLIGWTPPGKLPDSAFTGNPTADMQAQSVALVQYGQSRPQLWAQIQATSDPTLASQLWSQEEAPLVPYSDTRPALIPQIEAAMGSPYVGATPGQWNYQPSSNPDGSSSSAGTVSYNPFIANPLSDVQQIWADIGGSAGGVEKTYQAASRFVAAVVAPSTWLRFSEVIFGAVLLSGGIAMFAMVLASSGPGANLVGELAGLIPGEGQAARIGTSAARGTASFARASGRRAPRVPAPTRAPRLAPSSSRSSSSHTGQPHRTRTHASPRVGAAERQVSRTFRDATGDADDARYSAAKRARRENKQVHKHFMDTRDLKRRTP